MSSQLELALDKIRIHTSSKLLHQKTPATLLVALEQTFAEQTPPTPRSAVAYCAALLPGALYLLAAVLPYVPTPVIRSQVSVLLPLLAPLLPLSSQHPPALRSLLSVLCALWTPLDAPTLTGTPLVRNAWASVLQLCVDPRPKVRKRAQEVVRSVLAAPPAPMIRHPYAEQTAQYILKLLTDISPDHAEATIWSCAWVKILAPFWPTTKLVELLQALLTLPSLNIPFLTAAAYTTITAILTPPQTTLNPEAQDQATGSTIPPPTLPPTHFPASLATLLSLPPTGDADAAPWIGAVGACLYAWGEICRDPEAIEEAPSLSQDLLLAVPGAFRALWAQLEEGHSSEVRAAAEDAIVHGLLAGIFGDDGKVRSNGTEGGKTGGVSDLLVKECLKVWGKGPKNVKKTSLGLILTTLESSLDSVSAASSGALGNVLSVAEGVIDVLGTNSEVGGKFGSLVQVSIFLIFRNHHLPYHVVLSGGLFFGHQGPTPATTLAPSLLTAVGTLRSAQDFMWREKADGVIGAAIRAMGPAAFLEVLPMNLIPDKNAPNNDGRAYLLPLLAANLVPRTAEIRHFVSHFIPLSEKLFELQNGTEKESERKIWEVCIHQVWGCFRGYCTGLAGLKQGLSTPFLQLLINLLYSQPTLRVSILHGIRALVASNRSIPADEIHYSYAERSCAEENLKFLAGLAGNMLSVLFNVFSSVESNDRGLVGEVISLWLGLADAKELSATFKKVSAMLSQNLKGAAATPLAHTALDLLVLLVPHLSPTDATKLFTIVFADNVISNADGTVQKKAYRILARLIERGIVDGLQEGEGKNRKVESALARCAEITPSVNVSAKRDRVQLLSALVPLIPGGSLHIIPSLLPEAVLATKEVSEKTRNGAFDLVVAMGKRMERGGTVDRAKVDGMEVEQEGNEPTNVKANVEEYVTMVAAGLVGATPHMISATITTLSRLTFEFKDILSPNMLSELITTVIVFVSSANREIVKSALGFAKVSVISLPTNIVTPHLDALVPALLGSTIFERMGRRFGWESLEAAAGTHERAGVITHLRKKKERARKKKGKENEQESDVEEAPARTTTGDAFEDVLYGSDSDSSDADSEAESKPSTAQKAKDRSNSDGKKQKSGMRIRLDNDEPMDLLHGSAARLTTGSAMSARRRQPGHEAAKFKTDASTGRMVVEESSDEDEQDAGDDVAGAAYREMLTSTDGQTRDSSGKVRFAKDTKKRRALEREDAGDDVEMADGTDAGLARESPKKKSKRNVIKVGGEFKAKNAGGDVKRQSQQDPYAYLPLGSLNKKKGRQGPRISITGRR
ncbi:ribosomal RNA-processing protein 12 [Rhizoctonia solani]|uniref:Ribosomal RNA-processing protein 12 n=1 Tax=Rhizoctonia solani TaxID=456999 RepID=A0A8H8P3H5_9AGAM|nr:ribosomal RNA-processing protein 12 [Rhizoctonia solani]QRW23973.1 ribosomal RNA-processing protein 12 [Rhizoctonia solani]